MIDVPNLLRKSQYSRKNTNSPVFIEKAVRGIRRGDNRCLSRAKPASALCWQFGQACSDSASAMALVAIRVIPIIITIHASRPTTVATVWSVECSLALPAAFVT